MSETPKKFHIQRRRLGRIKHVEPTGKYGFIDAEDFREDVFFHASTWQDDAGPLVPRAVGVFVEFELDDEHRDSGGKLRASVVRPTQRPEGMQLDEHADPRLQVKHHPRARQRRPSWRKGSDQ